MNKFLKVPETIHSHTHSVWIGLPTKTTLLWLLKKYTVWL